MKKFVSSLRIGVIAFILLTVFIGCGANMPEPYVQPVKNYNNITYTEKQKLLSQVMKEIPKFYPNKKGRYSYPSRVYGDVISYNGLNAKFAHRFIIDNYTIYRKDISEEYYGKGKGEEVYGTLENDFGFSDYINKFQIKLGKLYNTYAQKYSQFKKEYIKNLKKAELKKQHIQLKIVDITHVLPKSIIDKLSSYIYLNVYSNDSLMNLFIKNKKPDSFIIRSFIKNNIIDRYKVIYDRSSYMYNYKIFPSSIIYKIKKVYFNYLPKKFVANDKNIAIEVLNTPFDYNSIKYIKIFNKTKKFIKVDTIAGYYGKDVIDNILGRDIKIPPMSYKVIQIKYMIHDFPKNKFLLVTNKNQKVDYGFSVAYKMVNQNIIKNLYKVNRYMIKDFK